jgi:hypothetical protein
MYNDPSAKDLLAMYPRQYADGGAVNDPVQSFQAPAVQQRKTSLTPIYAPGQVPAGYTGNYIDPTTLSASQQNARIRAGQDKVIRDAISQTGVDSFGGRDYRQLQQEVRRGDINTQNIKQQFVDPIFEKRVKSAYESIGRTGAVMPALQTTSKGALDEASYKNVTQAEYDYWSNLLKQGKISGKDFQKAFLSEAANEIPGTNLEAQRVYIDNARKALGLPELVSKPAATPYDPVKEFGVPPASNVTNLNSPIISPASTVSPVNLSIPASTPSTFLSSALSSATTAPVQPVNLSTPPSTGNLSGTSPAVTTPPKAATTYSPQVGFPMGNTGNGLTLTDMIKGGTYNRPTSGFGMASVFNQGGPVEKKSGESEAASDSSAADLEQFLLDNSRTQLGPVDVQEVRSARGPGKYDTRLSKNIDGLEAFADVDVNDKKLSQLGARFTGQGRIGNYEVQYVYDPETKQPVITGAIRKEMSPTSGISAQGEYVPQKDGKDYYNAGVRYTKRFEDGGEVTNENVRTLRSIDVTPEDKPEKSRVRENLDAIMQGLKNEDISAKDVALFINSFIPVTGDIQSAAELYQALKDKDYLGAGLGAAGALPLVPNTTKFVRGSISDLINKVKNERGEYMGRRAERAADEVPNLEDQYSEKALENTLMDRSNPQALMVLDPKDFEEYAMPIAPGLTGSAGEYRGFKVPEGMTYDQYIDYLAKAARRSGFTDVPFLNLSGTAAGGVRISGHEGRHRTRALAKLGDKSTLVRLQPDYNLTSTDARRYKDDYIEALKARLGLDPTVAPEAFPDVQIPMPEPFKHGGEVTDFIKTKKFEDGGEVRTLKSINVTPEDKPPVTAADIERMMKESYLSPNGVAPEMGEVKPKYPALNAWSKGLEMAAAPFDKYALDKRIPLVGGMTAADFMGLNSTASLARDVSYGDPVVRGKSLQTSKIDPRLLAVADIVPVAGAAAKGATTLAKAGAKEVARQVETGTGVIGRNTMDPRMYIDAYHGSPKDFDKFDINAPKNTSGGLNKHGIFLSPEKEVGKRYAEDFGKEGVLYKVDADVKKPLSLTATQYEKLQSIVGKLDENKKLNEFEQMSLEDLLGPIGWDMKQHPIEAIKKAGYDSITKSKGKFGVAESELMVFDPNKLQILDKTPVGTKKARKQSTPEEFIKSVYDDTPQSPFNPDQHAFLYNEGEKGAFFDLRPSKSVKGATEVYWFSSFPQREGVGTKGMQQLQRLAAEQNVPLTLSPWKHGTVSETALKKFYKKLGFTPREKGSSVLVWHPDQTVSTAPKGKYAHGGEVTDFIKSKK